METENQNIEQASEKIEEAINPEMFVEFVLGVLSTNSNPIIKGIKTDIENCLKTVPGLYDKDKQKQVLRDIMLNIISDNPLNDGQKKALNSQYSIKKFLKPREDIYLEYVLLDLIYDCYDIYREDLKNYTEFIDKISDFINKE